MDKAEKIREKLQKDYEKFVKRFEKRILKVTEKAMRYNGQVDCYWFRGDKKSDNWFYYDFKEKKCNCRVNEPNKNHLTRYLDENGFHWWETENEWYVGGYRCSSRDIHWKV